MSGKQGGFDWNADLSADWQARTNPITWLRNRFRGQALAPVPLPLDTCSVKLVRKKRGKLLSLWEAVRAASCQRMRLWKNELKQNINLQISSRIETEPWGGVRAGWALQSSCWDLAQSLRIRRPCYREADLGRVRGKWGPLVWLMQYSLHRARRGIIPVQTWLFLILMWLSELFVLQSLVEIAPHFVDPVQKKASESALGCSWKMRRKSFLVTIFFWTAIVKWVK